MNKNEQRFWSKVRIGDDCWPWVAHCNEDGYGQIGWLGKVERAHRVSFALEHGSIPGGLHVLHRCDNPACVRPGHLFTGTNAENMADKAAKDRQASGSRNGRAKLTEQDVRAIRSSAETRTALAKRYGVTQSVVSKIVLGKTWRAVRALEAAEKA